MYGINCITRLGRSPDSPHVLSWVSKVPKRVSQIFQYCFPKCVIPMTDYTSTFCLIVPSSKRLPLRALVKSPISHFTGSRDYASQPVSSPSRPRISTLSNPHTGTTIRALHSKEQERVKTAENGGIHWNALLYVVNINAWIVLVHTLSTHTLLSVCVQCSVECQNSIGAWMWDCVCVDCWNFSWRKTWMVFVSHQPKAKQ